jgi:hypothetical protein
LLDRVFEALGRRRADLGDTSGTQGSLLALGSPTFAELRTCFSNDCEATSLRRHCPDEILEVADLVDLSAVSGSPSHFTGLH